MFECSGVPALANTALEQVRAGGTIVVLALYDDPVTFNPTVLVQKEIRLQGSIAYTGEDFADAVELLRSGKAQSHAAHHPAGCARRHRGGLRGPASEGPLAQGRRDSKRRMTAGATESRAPSADRAEQRPFELPPGSTEVVLVRHGASEAAVVGSRFPLVDGHSNPALSAAGRAQAQTARRRAARRGPRRPLRHDPAPHPRKRGAAGRGAGARAPSSCPSCARSTSATSRAASTGSAPAAATRSSSGSSPRNAGTRSPTASPGGLRRPHPGRGRADRRRGRPRHERRRRRPRRRDRPALPPGHRRPPLRLRPRRQLLDLAHRRLRGRPLAAAQLQRHLAPDRQNRPSRLRGERCPPSSSTETPTPRASGAA